MIPAMINGAFQGAQASYNNFMDGKIPIISPEMLLPSPPTDGTPSNSFFTRRNVILLTVAAVLATIVFLTAGKISLLASQIMTAASKLNS